MKAYRTSILVLVTALAAAGLGFIAWPFFTQKTTEKTQPVEAELIAAEPEDDGFRDCPEDAQEQIANDPVQKPVGAYCIPDLLPFDKPVGPLHPEMSLESLQAACGDVLADFLFYLGEGQCQWGTALYHGTGREIQIAWRNWKDKRIPSFIRFVGSELHFENGLAPGMLLSDVVRLNGKAVTLAGFGWEASGYHRSFQGGQLGAFDGLGEAHYLIRYTLNWELFDTATDEEHASLVIGEGTLESSIPALEKFQARVDWIEWIFNAEALKLPTSNAADAHSSSAD